MVCCIRRLVHLVKAGVRTSTMSTGTSLGVLQSENDQVTAESPAFAAAPVVPLSPDSDSTGGKPVGRKRHPSPDLNVPLSRRKRQKEDAVQMGNLSHIQYYFENGLRKVVPYYFTWNTHAKGRWIGQTLGKVFLEEFAAANEEVAQARVNSEGSLFVNGQPATKDYVIKHNDFISHYMHRHEAPVTDKPIRIVVETEDILVLDKPASIPIHPCGRFRANSVMYILAIEHGRTNLRVVHRLDRLTSGLLLVGKTIAAAQNFHDQLVERAVKKTYIARVRGQFPSGTIACEDSIECVNKRAGVHQVTESGRGCVTEFSILRHDPTSDTSTVQCRPLTGRTHQIRVHLQHLGYPIVNDPVYGASMEKWKAKPITVADEGGQELKLVSLDEPAEVSLESVKIVPAEGSPAKGRETKQTVVIPSGVPMSSDGRTSTADFDEWDGKCVRFRKLTKLPEKDWADPQCPECWLDFMDPSPDELRIDLHCWKYEGVGWQYETELPEWAKENTIC